MPTRRTVESLAHDFLGALRVELIEHVAVAGVPVPHRGAELDAPHAELGCGEPRS